jgi:hypothetical protein
MQAREVNIGRASHFRGIFSVESQPTTTTIIIGQAAA